jgi:protein-tyrosine phosphatase
VKFLFVCTGNICRSPLAEGILKDKLNKYHIKAEVDSAGLEEFHVGDPPDARAIATAAKRRIDISGHRVRLFEKEDFTRFDRIYIMDSYHYMALSGMSRSDEDMHKVDYIMNVLEPGKNTHVQDPWYDGIDAFEKVYEQLDRACEKIADWIRK